MAISPQKLREIVFLLLYSADCGGSSDAETLPLLMKELAVSKKVLRQAIEIKESIDAKAGELDSKIAQYATSYEFDRIPRVERNVLRLGIFEMLCREDIPEKVAIAEAIRLSRKFSAPESAAFINAVMDAIFQAELIRG